MPDRRRAPGGPLHLPSQPAAEGAYRANGYLTIRNVTKPMTFEAALRGVALDLQGGKHLGATASFAIDRAAFGLV